MQQQRLYSGLDNELERIIRYFQCSDKWGGRNDTNDAE